MIEIAKLRAEHQGDNETDRAVRNKVIPALEQKAAAELRGLDNQSAMSARAVNVSGSMIYGDIGNYDSSQDWKEAKKLRDTALGSAPKTDASGYVLPSGADDVPAYLKRLTDSIGGLSEQAKKSSQLPDDIKKLTTGATPADAPKKFAVGGTVPGSGSGDTVPAWLTPGEFVLTPEQYRKNKWLVHSIVRGDAQHFAGGGEVGEDSDLPAEWRNKSEEQKAMYRIMHPALPTTRPASYTGAINESYPLRRESSGPAQTPGSYYTVISPDGTRTEIGQPNDGGAAAATRGYAYDRERRKLRIPIPVQTPYERYREEQTESSIPADIVAAPRQLPAPPPYMDPRAASNGIGANSGTIYDSSTPTPAPKWTGRTPATRPLPATRPSPVTQSDSISDWKSGVYPSIAISPVRRPSGTVGARDSEILRDDYQMWQNNAAWAADPRTGAGDDAGSAKAKALYRKRAITAVGIDALPGLTHWLAEGHGKQFSGDEYHYGDKPEAPPFSSALSSITSPGTGMDGARKPTGGNTAQNFHSRDVPRTYGLGSLSRFTDIQAGNTQTVGGISLTADSWSRTNLKRAYADKTSGMSGAEIFGLEGAELKNGGELPDNQYPSSITSPGAGIDGGRKPTGGNAASHPRNPQQQAEDQAKRFHARWGAKIPFPPPTHGAGPLTDSSSPADTSGMTEDQIKRYHARWGANAPLPNRNTGVHDVPTAIASSDAAPGSQDNKGGGGDQTSQMINLLRNIADTLQANLNVK